MDLQLREGHFETFNTYSVCVTNFVTGKKRRIGHRYAQFSCVQQTKICVYGYIFETFRGTKIKTSLQAPRCHHCWLALIEKYRGTNNIGIGKQELSLKPRTYGILCSVRIYDLCHVAF